MSRRQTPHSYGDIINSIIAEVEYELEFRGFTEEDFEFDKENGILIFNVTNNYQLDAIFQMIPQCLLNNGITTIIK